MRAAFRFEGVARQAIHDLKYRGIRNRAELLGDALAEAIERRPLDLDLLAPVPLAPGRRRQRGFNQSELIAQVVGERIGTPVDGSCLRRVRETPAQVRLAADERRRNMHGAFTCPEGSLIAGLRIAVVDDVMTTGATLEACAEVLRSAGAARVYGLVAARDV